MGGGFHFVASHWILYERTESAQSMAWLVISYMLPLLIVNPICGVLVDRYNRRRLLSIAVGYQMFLDLGLIGLMASGQFHPSHLFIYAPLMSVGGALYGTALPAFLREKLDRSQLLHANSLNTALMQGGYLLGAGLAGLCYPVLGAIGSFSVDAFSFAVGLIGWVIIKRWFPDRSQIRQAFQARLGFLREFQAGVVYAKSNLALFLLALFSLVPAFAAHSVNVLLAGFCKDSLKAGPEGFGLLDMSYGLGAMLCGLILPACLLRVGLRPWLPTLAILFGATATCMLSFADTVVTAMCWMTFFALATHVAGIITSTTLQKNCEERMMGRVTSLVSMLKFLVAPVLVWVLGRFADGAKGSLIHQDPLRDGFVAVSVFNLTLATISLFVVYPFLRRTLKKPSDSFH